MQINGFDFKPIEVESRYKQGVRQKRVYLASRREKDGTVSWAKLALSVDIADKAPFEEDDTVEVLECGNVFAIRKCEPSKFATKFKVRKWSSTYSINSIPLAQYIHKKTNQTEFRAWVAGDMVMFSTEE